jgi:hypothetical protein
MALLERKEWSRGGATFKRFHMRLTGGAKEASFIDEPPDPRVAELERLHLSLARTAERLDEFETQLKQTIGIKRTLVRVPMSTADNFADHVATCFKKSRRS